MKQKTTIAQYVKEQWTTDIYDTLERVLALLQSIKIIWNFIILFIYQHILFKKETKEK